MRLAGPPRHALQSTALALSIALLLSGCVSGKPAAEHIVDGVAAVEPAPDPAEAAGSAKIADATAGAEPVDTDDRAQGAGQVPPLAEPGPLTLQGTGLKAKSSSIFSTGAPVPGISPAATQSGDASAHNLFRAGGQSSQPVLPLPQDGAQATPQPAAPAPQAMSDAAGRDTASVSLIGLFAAAGKARKAPGTSISRDEGNMDVAFAAGMAPQQAAALSYAALPAIGARSMFATVDDTAADHDDDSPKVEMASLPGLARLAPSGLLIQTDTVETGCFKPQLMTLLQSVETHFGRKLLVTSGHRSLVHNAKVGGRPASRHLTCEAADIQVPGITKSSLATYLRSLPGRGGVGTYCHTQSVHIDIGRVRDWNWQCRTRDV